MSLVEPRLTLTDAIVDPTTRVRALETAVVAYAVLMPKAIPTQLKVSPSCGLVLDAIFGRHYAEPRYALEATVFHHTAWETDEALRMSAIGLAADAASVTVQDLASVGDLRIVLEHLADARRHTGIATTRAKAA